MSFTPEIEADLAALAERYGQPRTVVVPLHDVQFDPLSRTDRYGEVCMVIRRRNGLLLTAIKTFYPAGCFRLLTGGINHGEPILDALLREIAEETGLTVAVRRFLAVIRYTTDDPVAPQDAFVTFAFLLDELSGTLTVSDPDERVGAFREVSVAELPAMAETLEAAPDQFAADIEGVWRSWGIFRAVVHRVVYEELSR